MKGHLSFFCLCLLLHSYLNVCGQEKNNPSATAPVAAYLFDGNILNSAPGGGKAKIKQGNIASGHDGKAHSAYSFSIHPKTYNSSVQNMNFPIDINPSKFPLLTITAWVKATNCFRKMLVLVNGTDKYARGLIIDKHDDNFRFGMNCGKDGILYGPPLIDEWTFIAMIYDSRNQAARFIINDQVYSSRATTRDNADKAFVGAFNGTIDDIRFFDRILTQAEIEQLSGKPITGNLSELEIKDRYSYKEKRKLKEENKIKVGDIYIVDAPEYKLFDTTNQTNATKILGEGDTLYVISKYDDGWYKVTVNGGASGFTTRGTIIKYAYPSGGSSFFHKLSYEFSHIFDFTKLRSWIIVAIFAIILFFVKRYFIRLDLLLIRLRKGGDEFAGGGSKNDTSSHSQGINFLHKIYPVKAFQWYPLLTGLLLGATLFIGSFWDGYEMEWFYNEGFNILPIGYDRPIHWFFYGMTLLTILLTISWCIESFVVAGPWVGLLRILILFILNFMSLLVSFFLLVLVAAFVLIMIGLWVFGNTVGSGSYKCPSCGRSFSASAGSSVSCPGCGASLST
ncbi:MAG: hypothetical protein IPH45_02405 [Bacteroidales bacterium]|nr:hypothetical protein [Bacteroidales bacterium]